MFAPVSICGGTKTIPGGASVHTKERRFSVQDRDFEIGAGGGGRAHPEPYRIGSVPHFGAV